MLVGRFTLRIIFSIKNPSKYLNVLKSLDVEYYNYSHNEPLSAFSAFKVSIIFKCLQFKLFEETRTLKFNQITCHLGSKVLNQILNHYSFKGLSN